MAAIEDVSKTTVSPLAAWWRHFPYVVSENPVTLFAFCLNGGVYFCSCPGFGVFLGFADCFFAHLALGGDFGFRIFAGLAPGGELAFHFFAGASFFLGAGFSFCRRLAGLFAQRFQFGRARAQADTGLTA